MDFSAEDYHTIMSTNLESAFVLCQVNVHTHSLPQSCTCWICLDIQLNTVVTQRQAL